MSNLISIGVLLASQFGFYSLGNLVLTDYIVAKNSFDKPDPLIKFVFFSSICTSLTLLELLGCELLDLMPTNLRWFIWKLCLIILLLLLVIIVPFLQLKLLLCDPSKSQYPKILIPCFLIYLWCFYKIGSIFPIFDDTISTSLFSIPQGIGRIGIIGVTILALISGYGSVSGPATLLFVRKVSSDHLESAERDYKHAERVLEDKKDRFQKFCEQKISEKSKDSSLNWFMKRVSTAINFNSTDQDSKIIYLYFKIFKTIFIYLIVCLFVLFRFS